MTARIVTTAEELRDLPHGTHLRGALGQAYLVLDGGVFAAGRAIACTDEALTLPATVLAPAIDPDDPKMIGAVSETIWAHGWTHVVVGGGLACACRQWRGETHDEWLRHQASEVLKEVAE